MPKVTSTIMRDIEITHSEPETAAEIDKMAGVEGTAAELAVRYYKHHVWMNVIRSALAKKLEELTSITRLTKEKDGKQVIDETDTSYYERLAREGHLDGIDINAEAQKVVDANPMDFKRRVRDGSGAAREVATKWIEAARQIEAAGKLKKFAKKHDLKLGDDNEENLRIVANKIRTIHAAERKAAEQRALQSVEDL